ncbi:MAG: AAA family ATPase [Deltaproteobacteria bacterium]|nr:AAA family ATPase [Deltaproteobacteria bacterium]
MSQVFAVAGKGGTGKTTLAALIIRHLRNRNRGPVLAVDADPNSNLAEALGVKAAQSLGKTREDFQGSKSQLPPGMTKDIYLEMKLHEILVESPGVDLMVMGRPEGPGCYCYANHILRRHLDFLASNYPFVVMDNEAGMEHLSRRTTQGVDHLLFLSDYSIRGVRTVGRIRELIEELRLSIREKHLVVDRAPAELAPAFRKEMELQGIPLLGTVPLDPLILEYDLEGKPLLELPEGSSAVAAVAGMMARILPEEMESGRPEAKGQAALSSP